MAGEWRDSTLGEVTDFLSGGTPSKSRADYWNGSIPWVSAKDMKQFRLGDSQDHVTEAGASNGTRLAPAGSVLLLVRGMTLLNDLPICVIGKPMTFNQDVKALRPNIHVTDDFLPYLLLGNKHRLLSRVDLAGHGTGRLNSDELKALTIGLPTEPEQRAIAYILGTLDDKIELNRRRNQTLEAMARALFKDWFVDFGPVRAKMEGREPYLPAELWQLFPDRLDDEGKPEGWEMQPLDEIAAFLNGLALQKFPATDPDDNFPVIKIAELRNGVSAKSGRASLDVPDKYIIKDGDFLFSWSGSLLAKFWTEGKGALNQHLFKVTSERYPMWFVSHWVYHHLETFQAIAASKATTMGHIQRGHLKATVTLCPPDIVLERLGVVMAPLVEQAIHNQLESRNLAQLRDTLLPKLISGALRIADAEKFLSVQSRKHTFNSNMERIWPELTY
ncbi:restriction endonuclease subunit S [Pseudohalioglobus lutimaris]|nr:restriction endonuclease subunit S [Pseudohalioglobus lutimaris]